MNKIIWLLDFDGVINASKAGWSASPKSRWAYVKGEGYRIRWEPALIERIVKINNYAGAEVVWATSWCGYTRQLEQLLAMPELRDAADFEMGLPSKLKAAQKVLNDGDKLIWTDDKAIPLEWHNNSDKLLIRPRTSRGLRPEHLDEIDKFVLQSAT